MSIFTKIRLFGVELLHTDGRTGRHNEANSPPPPPLESTIAPKNET